MVIKLLPSYFDELIPKKSIGSTVYSIQNAQNQMPKIKHEYAKNSFRCKLIKIKIINYSDFYGMYLIISTLTLFMNLLIILQINS